MKIYEGTGLPVLPEGLFWKVRVDTDEYAQPGFLRVGVAQKVERRWFFRKVTESQYIPGLWLEMMYDDFYMLTDKNKSRAISRLAERVCEIYRTRVEDEKLRHQRKVAVDALLGEYPPKRLESGD